MAHFNFVISQNAKWGHAGFYIDCHRMTSLVQYRKIFFYKKALNINNSQKNDSDKHKRLCVIASFTVLMKTTQNSASVSTSVRLTVGLMACMTNSWK